MAAMNNWVWLFFIFLGATAQHLGSKVKDLGICRSMYCNSVESLKRLESCVVILGNLNIVLMENTHKQSFTKISFPGLKEITGYLIVYRVRGLTSLGQLLPGLSRIRGSTLFDNYALIVHDMPNLEMLGLSDLLKIDRGGVIVWGSPTTCFMNTVNWKSIAPKARHVLGPVREGIQCTTPCTCSGDYSTNYCWNNKSCQRFIEGPDAEVCHEQCFGCRKTNKEECSLCRNYTLRKQCVTSCPNDTVILNVIKYCITTEECNKLRGWVWDGACVFVCPLAFKVHNVSGIVTCEPCPNCDQTCGTQRISSLDALQAAERCVYINGSLIIHIRIATEATEELYQYLSRIEDVSDYVLIYGSMTITSLDFLPALKRIGGRKLKNGVYSLIIFDMKNLQTLFNKNVTANLKINRGTVKIINNPMLCKHEIEPLQRLFPKEPSIIDVPEGMNGYSGNCFQVGLELHIEVINLNTAQVKFTIVPIISVSYSILYVRLTSDSSTVVPEGCSDSKWFVVPVPTSNDKKVVVQIDSLKPASTYALCVEGYDSLNRNLTRSAIVNFSTPVGKPEPPFISEVVASSANVIVLRWTDHRDYQRHITHYELDVSMIDIPEHDVTVRDQCKNPVSQDVLEDDYDISRHAVVFKSPPEYEVACESMCGILSTATAGAMVQDDFDPCMLGLDCNDAHEADRPGNETLGEYYKSLAIIVNGSSKEYQVGGLAPYRDYRIRLRACSTNNCSRSTRRTVRTMALKDADKATISTVDVRKNGIIAISWLPPPVPNGPVLSYNVQVLTRTVSRDSGYAIPQSWCVLSTNRQLTLRTERMDYYLIRVCTVTLVSSNTCTDWMKISYEEKFSASWWLGGVVLGILICVISSFLARRRENDGDMVPLVDMAPDLERTDFDCMYTIPLRDTEL